MVNERQLTSSLCGLLGTNLGGRCLTEAVANFPSREVFIMFMLFYLILTSPIGAFVVARFQEALYLVIVASDCEDCGFNDLGTLLFGGVLAAILVGVGVSVVLRRYKDKSPSLEFVSIRASDTNNPQ